MAHQPAFEACAKFVCLFLRRFEKNKITGIVHRHPGAGGGVDVVVLIDGDERARIGTRARRAVDDIAAFAITVFAFMRGDYADKIEQGKDRLARQLARAPTQHLAIERDRFCVAGENEIDDFRAVETGVEHIHRHQHLREFFFLETADARHRIGSVFALPHAGDNVISILYFRRGFQVGEFIVDQHRQSFGMALGDGEDDGLADHRFAQIARGIGIAIIHHFAEFAHNGLIARGNGEFTFQHIGVEENMRLRCSEVGSGDKSIFKFFAGLGIKHLPLDVIAQNLDAIGGGGLDRLCLVDLVADQITIVDGAFKRVGKGWLIHTEKTQGVAHEGGCIVGCAIFVGWLDAGRGGHADLDAVEVLQHLAPLAVDAAMAFVGDDEIEIAG